MSFWGLTLECGKRYAQKVEKSFHVSMAALDLKSPVQGQGDGISIYVSVDKNDYLICNLARQKLMQQNLDLLFDEGEEIAFLAKGKGVVHLTGYIVPQDYPVPMGEGFGSESDEEEDEELMERQQKFLKDFTKQEKKRKSESQVNKKDAKKAKISDEDSDEDEEDSSDVEEEEESDEEESEALKQLKTNTLKQMLGAQMDEDDSDEGEEEEDSEEGEEEEEDETGSESDDESEDEEDAIFKAKQQKQQAQQKQKGQEGAQKKTPNKAQDAQNKTPNKATLVNGASPKQDQSAKKKNAEEKQTPKSTEKKAGQAKSPKTPNDGQPKVLQGGVRVHDLNPGTGPVAKNGQMVNVYYVGRLQSNNKVFDQTQTGSGFKFRLGGSEVIKGWDVGLQGMKVGGKRKIICPPHMAYGSKGSPPVIPPNSTLVFEVELKNVK